MIDLKVEDYCHECPEFEADTRKSALFADGEIVAAECVIVCEHSAKCAHIKQFLEDQLCK